MQACKAGRWREHTELLRKQNCTTKAIKKNSSYCLLQSEQPGWDLKKHKDYPLPQQIPINKVVGKKGGRGKGKQTSELKEDHLRTQITLTVAHPCRRTCYDTNLSCTVHSEPPRAPTILEYGLWSLCKWKAPHRLPKHSLHFLPLHSTFPA